LEVANIARKASQRAEVIDLPKSFGVKPN